MTTNIASRGATMAVDYYRTFNVGYATPAQLDAYKPEPVAPRGNGSR